ncbi:MAG TPA: HEAT repeat domain-containing protein [Planctomycetota bacterium]|nr:HEAT repeat domain-containing protein [Planctomycetota bacterium]
MTKPIHAATFFLTVALVAGTGGLVLLAAGSTRDTEKRSNLAALRSIAAARPSSALGPAAPLPKDATNVDAPAASPRAASRIEPALGRPAVVAPARLPAAGDDAAMAAIRRSTSVTFAVTGLRDPDAARRIDALRAIRDEGLAELVPQVERIALEDPDALVRRFAAQTLALDAEFGRRRDTLVELARSDDWTIRANALFGLSRTGDEESQAKLLDLATSLEVAGTDHLDGLARALASPELHGARIMAHFRARATDPAVPEDERFACGQALCMKTLAANAR